MSIHRASSVVCIALALVVSACDDAPLTSAVNSPTSVPPARTFATSGIGVSPSQIHPILLAGASCPDPRFVAPFTLGISGNGLSDVFLVQVDMQFVDRVGVTTPMLSITRASLLERFASTRIAALERRSFPFEFPLGCTSASSGTLFVTVAVDDAQQRERRTTMTMPVR